MKLDGIEIINSKNLELNDIHIKGVLFDMDGIILDTEKLYTRFWQEAANALGYPMTKEQALGMRSLNRAAGTAQIQSYFGENASFQDIRDKRIEMMDAFVEQEGVELKPGIRELLAYLKEHGIKSSVATSSPLDRTVKYLGSVNLDKEFDELVSGYMVPHGKPEPDIYLYAAEKLGLDPKDCMVLEDSPAGAMAGTKAGCVTVMVPDQDQPNEKTRELLFAKADSLFQVMELLEYLK